MRILCQAVLAGAVAAVFMAPPAHGQTVTTNTGVWSGSIPAPTARSDERASAVIRVIDADVRGAGSVAIDTAELARARASGEIQASEGTSAYVLERIRPRAGQPAVVDARDDVAKPTRAELQATARYDDVARSREHARYEIDRKRREAEQVGQAREMQARAVEIQRSRASGERRAEISWSPPERQVARAPEPIVRVNPPVPAMPSATGGAGIAADDSTGTE